MEPRHANPKTNSGSWRKRKRRCCLSVSHEDQTDAEHPFMHLHSRDTLERAPETRDFAYCLSHVSEVPIWRFDLKQIQNVWGFPSEFLMNSARIDSWNLNLYLTPILLCTGGFCCLQLTPSLLWLSSWLKWRPGGQDYSHFYISPPPSPLTPHWEQWFTHNRFLYRVVSC